ncbi:sodium/glucose cotransporter [bacterium BMS3Abin04]|nr:sodium/glucose cotransporter [bacterium BMS3Abin04]
MILGITYLDLAVILVYITIIIYMGWWTKKKVQNSGDYFMGGRKGNKLMMIANAFGAGTHTDQAIAVSGATYQIGLAGIWYQWIWLLATPFYWIIAPIYRRVRYVTLADFFEERYGPKIGVAYSIMGILFFMLNLGLILKGTGTAIEAVTHGAMSTEIVVVVLTLFFLGYSVLGGLVSALIVNLIQGLFILVMSFLLIPFALNAIGGMAAAKAALPDYMFSFIAPTEVTLYFIIAVVINGLVGIVVQPHHMAVGGAGKTESACRTGWTYGNFTKRFATLGWALVGILAAALFPGLGNKNRELAFGTAVANLLPSGLVGLMIAAMAAAVLAACHNFMVAGSALFTRNIIPKINKTKFSGRSELKFARLTSVAVVLGGVLIALTIPSVVQGVKYLWQITAYFGIGFWMAVMWRKSNRYGVWASVIVTIIITFITGPYFSFGLGWPLEYQITAYLPAGFIAFILVSNFTKPEPKEKLDKFYALLHTPVGEEYKLKEKGFDIMLAGEIDEKAQNYGEPLEERGHSLIVVDFLNIRKKFSFKRYKIDVVGFLYASLFVIVILAIGYAVANLW